MTDNPTHDQPPGDWLQQGLGGARERNAQTFADRVRGDIARTAAADAGTTSPELARAMTDNPQFRQAVEAWADTTRAEEDARAQAQVDAALRTPARARADRVTRWLHSTVHREPYDPLSPFPGTRRRPGPTLQP